MSRTAAKVSAPTSVQARVADHKQALSANVDGLLVGLRRADARAEAGRVTVSLDYAAIAQAYGGGWGSRLHLVTMPGCVLTTPQVAACLVQEPLETVNDAAGQTLTAAVDLPATSTVTLRSTAVLAAPAASQSTVAVAAVSGSGGSQGDYTSTSLSSSGAWAQTSSGGFTYGYPLVVPASLSGSAPSVALSYNSQAIDGETSARNSQSSWIGDGWSYEPGFIERSFKACSSSGIKDSGDKCWGGYNATMSLGSRSGELVRDSSGVLHLQSDDGTKIERLTGAANGLWSGEFYRVTTPDGTAYYFGENHAPGTTADASTGSAWGVPVYHPKSGDPCYSAAKGAASQCDKPVGYRFNLDFVVDPHGNVQRYDYATESNYYNMGFGQVAASGDGGTLTSYTRGGFLKRISYGYKLADAVAGRDPAARVNFDTSQRCTTSDTVCTLDNLSKTTSSNWPDSPYDLNCPSSYKTSGEGDDVCHVGSPTFWSTYRLKTITTQVKVGTGFQDVDSYALTHVFSDAGGVIDPVTGAEGDTSDGAVQAVMWLSSIQHTGRDTTAGGADQITLDPVTFTGIETDNRVDGLTPAAPPLYHPRISSIRTETGESIAVTYRSAECSRVNHSMPSSPDSNTKACFPVYWYPPGAAEPISDWFTKTVVSQVTDSDLTKAGSKAKVVNYAYAGAAWHRDDSDLTDDQYRTWNDFRGYRTVTTTGGASPDPITKSVATYLQGMDGDYKADGTTRSVTVNGATDSNWLAGAPSATENVDTTAAGAPVTARSIIDPPVVVETANRSRTAWTSKEPAPNTLSDLPALTTHRLKSASNRGQSLLASGTWRTVQAITTYDDLGRVKQINDKGDLSDPRQETCTTISYAPAPATNLMMLVYPSETIAVAGPCGTAPGTTKTLSDQRVFYDGDGSVTNPGTYGVLGQSWPSDGATPQVHSLGYMTAMQSIKSYDGSGNPIFQTTGALSYDSYGRIVKSLDGAGSATTTTFTPPTAVLPTATTTTNPLGWVSTVTAVPTRGLVTHAVDANGRVTDSTFDALGRRTAVWLPGRDKTANSDSPDKTFLYAIHGAGTSPDPSAVTTRTLRENGSYSTAVTLYDGMLQVRQQQSTTADDSAGRLIKSSSYDSHGWPVSTIATYSDPNTAPSTTMFAEFENTVPSQTKTVYDGLGRPTAKQLWSRASLQWQSTTSYPGADETDTIPPKGGQATATFIDAKGQTTASRVKDTTPDRTLPAGTVIASGSTVASNSVRLTMQADGNLVLTGITSGAVLWASGTSGKPGASATVRTDGSLVVTSTTGTVLWTSTGGTAGTTGGYAMVRDDASVQMYNAAGNSRWSTGTAGKAAAADITTRYTYTPAGQTASIADTIGNTWTYQYNLQGQKISQTDPDSGTSTSGYDALGRLTQTTDARQQTLSYTYDILGRKTGEYAGTSTTDATKQLAGWSYDTLAKGLPVSSTRYVGGSTTSGSAYVKSITGYTTAYQPTGTTVVIPPAEGKLANTYTMAAKYTPRVGLLASTDYGPDGGLPTESVGYGYDLQGLLLETGSDDNPYLDTALYSPLGQIQQSTYGVYGKQLRTAQTYDDATGRLATNTVSLQPNEFGPIDATTYGYDQAGNLKAVSDTQSNGTAITGTDTQCFSYDGINRLSEAWTDTKGTSTPTTGQLSHCTTSTPTPGTIGGPASYWQSFTYNLLGDRTQQVKHDITGNALKNTTQSSSYPGNGTTAATQPNTAISVTTTDATGTTTLTPRYDAAGNTKSRDTKVGTAAATTQTFTYDAEGRTQSVTPKAGSGTVASSYLYDADGGLLVQKGPGSNILYLFGGAEQLTLDTAKQTVSGLRYYSHPDGTTITRSSTGTLTYQPANPQHTAQLQVNRTTLAVTRRAYDPYGAPRGTAPTGWADNHGYLGQPADTTTGLNLLGARNYDPVLGRFLTVDPIFEAGDPNQMGGYTYAGNDPVNGSDPTGLMWLRDGGGGGGGGSGSSGGDPGGNVTLESVGRGAIGALDSFVGPLYSAAANGVGYFNNAFATVASPMAPPPPYVAKDYSHPFGSLLGIDKSLGYKTGNVSGTIVSLAIDGLGLAKVLKFGYKAFKAARVAKEAKTAEKTAEDLVSSKTPSDTTPSADPAPKAPKNADESSAPGTGTQDKPAATEATRCSFSPDTPVLMDQGQTKPIGDITVGDKVEAADPDTGKHAGPHTVTATIINYDTDLLDVTVRGEDGKPATLHTTSKHPFWDDTTHTWVPAGKLQPGHALNTDEDQHVTVLTLHITPGAANRYNLTVAELHTYYVLAGQTPVLVHNTCQDSVVLGVGDHSNALASSRRAAGDSSAHTFNDGNYGDVSENGLPGWMNGVQEAVRNSNTRLTVSLDGLPGATPAEAFANAYTRGVQGGMKMATESSYGTSWEMSVIGRNVVLGNRSWDSINWYWNGMPATMHVPDFAAIRAAAGIK
ncbi:polymorphic toxin-type HINT domain-containing protein [Streptomyces sp. H39-S7]|uniref:polymorphic toxin-type HINT domain-containing protein n=1 Tax=Streptomyces sp. H39-S7 TaxID=3004357 RepID=UPI0022AEF4ED|nr:polymorphic toxin-type HINT domain-containing protein [Streptomyces sp. H39-S7]MCZ4119248.1 polymorphic toxin-type HINT domain-containing protein [Streptomyces sp. H39-S7]